MRFLRLTSCALLLIVLMLAAAAPPGNAGQSTDDAAYSAKKKRSAPDFRVSLGRLPAVEEGRLVDLRLRVGNKRKWPATSVQACASVSPKAGRVVSATRRGAIRFGGRSACWIVEQIKPKRSLSLRFGVRLKPGRGLKVAVKVTGGNSNSASRRFSRAVREQGKRGQKGQRGKKGGGKAQARAVIAAAGSCVRPATLGVVFVTDDSASMESSDPARLRAEAVSVGLDQLPDGSLAAATAFADFSSRLFPVSTVTSASRPGLKLAAEELFDSGTTDYEEAFLGAQAELAMMPGADKKAVIFLSDGAPNDPAFSADTPIAASGTPIYTIGLGADFTFEGEAILSGIAARSGGQYYGATSAGQLQSIFARIVAALTCDAQTVTESFRLEPGESRTIPFSVEASDGEFRALAAWSSGKVTVSAQRPDSSPMKPGSLLAGEGFVDELTYALLTGVNPAIGPWQLTVTADNLNSSGVDVTIDVFKRRLADPPPPPPALGRRLDPCIETYSTWPPKKVKKRFGEESIFDRSTSLFYVCAGWGAPDLDYTPTMECALIAAAATFGGPPVKTAKKVIRRACDVVSVADAYRTGNWLGIPKGKACGFFADVVAGAVGVFAAGATSASGPGAVAVGLGTYRALSASLNLACAGLLNGGAVALGVKIEGDHQTNVALDVIRKGKCIASEDGPLRISWKAVDCP
jgi:von Willebrand factor type A domain